MTSGAQTGYDFTIFSGLPGSCPGKVQNGRKHWLSCHWPCSPCQPLSPTVPRSALARKLASGERPTRVVLKMPWGHAKPCNHEREVAENYRKLGWWNLQPLNGTPFSGGFVFKCSSMICCTPSASQAQIIVLLISPKISYENGIWHWIYQIDWQFLVVQSPAQKQPGPYCHSEVDKHYSNEWQSLW